MSQGQKQEPKFRALPGVPRRKTEFRSAGPSALEAAGKEIAKAAEAVGVSVQNSARGSTSSRTSRDTDRPQRRAKTGNVNSSNNRSDNPNSAGASTEEEPDSQQQVRRLDMPSISVEIASPTDVNASKQDSSARTQISAAAVDVSRGGESFQKRLADLTTSNEQLKRQLELQTREVVALQEASKHQQQRFQDFERNSGQVLKNEVLQTENRIRGEAAVSETALRQQVEALREESTKERGDLVEQRRQMENELRKCEGERDEARARVKLLEERLEEILGKPENTDSRVKALHMELNLVKQRLARETEGRELAQRTTADSLAQQKELKVKLELSKNEAWQLRRALAEQAELAAFRQEQCGDLHTRMKEQRKEAEQRIQRERGKYEVVQRLEGILPRHMVFKALT
eukprot:gnl/TRDRNA2_/TRDRNA2_43228_c0_seq1.p1 gnl/TRDRNA2_/TRDRNA2_43228_c0~~gnl/TRDRNA2_/TRDRNA2_43228_c0_seq1.p1  ORF type:complete len:402 (-),score=93.25 gnl/TRDRNA2_/TRDRNA2_43228_c0_seq1:81-1286(-)